MASIVDTHSSSANPYFISSLPVPEYVVEILIHQLTRDAQISLLRNMIYQDDEDITIDYVKKRFGDIDERKNEIRMRKANLTFCILENMIQSVEKPRKKSLFNEKEGITWERFKSEVELSKERARSAVKIVNFFKEEKFNMLLALLYQDESFLSQNYSEISIKKTLIKRIAFLLKEYEDWLYNTLGTEYVRQLVRPEMVFSFVKWYYTHVTEKIFVCFQPEFYGILYEQLLSEYVAQKELQDDLTYSIRFLKNKIIFNLKELLLWIFVYKKEMMKEVNLSYIKNEKREFYVWFLFEDEAERDESGNIRKPSDLKETAAALSPQRPRKRPKYGGTAFLSSELSVFDGRNDPNISPFKFHNDSAFANADDGKTDTVDDVDDVDVGPASKLYNILLRF